MSTEELNDIVQEGAKTKGITLRYGRSHKKAASYEIKEFNLLELITDNTSGVYLWERAGVVLYVGSSFTLLARVLNHHVINKREAVQQGDKLHLIKTEDNDLEELLIRYFEPKYNCEFTTAASYCVKCSKPFRGRLLLCSKCR